MKPYPTDDDAPTADAATRARLWRRIQATTAATATTAASPHDAAPAPATRVVSDTAPGAAVAAVAGRRATGKLVASVLAATVAAAAGTTAVLLAREPAPSREVRAPAPARSPRDRGRPAQPSPVFAHEMWEFLDPVLHRSDDCDACTRVDEHDDVVGAEPGPVAPAPSPRPPEPLRADPTPRSAPPTLADERRLLEQASDALDAGDATTALEVLASHTARHAGGQLAEEREALAVRALVLAGRRDEARARATRFIERWPRSILRGGVEDVLE